MLFNNFQDTNNSKPNVNIQSLQPAGLNGNIFNNILNKIQIILLLFYDFLALVYKNLLNLNIFL